jgi:hypothetical protein
MKLSYILPFLLLACNEIPLKRDRPSKKTIHSSPTVEGVWWSIGDGTIDGMQLDPHGVLRYPGLYTMTGKGWKQSGDTLILTTTNLKYGYEDTTKYLIRSLDEKHLRISLTPGDTSFSILYQKIKVNANTDHFLGRWMGVEGNFIDIIPSKNRYKVMVVNYNNPEDNGRFTEYAGTVLGDELQITIGKSKKLISFTDGPGSGMKYLVDKNNCIKIQDDDGYCRD